MSSGVKEANIIEANTSFCFHLLSKMSTLFTILMMYQKNSLHVSIFTLANIISNHVSSKILLSKTVQKFFEASI